MDKEEQTRVAKARGEDFIIGNNGRIERVPHYDYHWPLTGEGQGVEMHPGDAEDCQVCADAATGPDEFPEFEKGFPYKPSYYKPFHPLPKDPDVIDIINSWKLPFALGCAVKHLLRYKRKPNPKGSEQDLHKAMEYIQRHLDREEEQSG